MSGDVAKVYDELEGLVARLKAQATPEPEPEPEQPISLVFGAQRLWTPAEVREHSLRTFVEIGWQLEQERIDTAERRRVVAAVARRNQDEFIARSRSLGY